LFANVLNQLNVNLLSSAILQSAADPVFICYIGLRPVSNTVINKKNIFRRRPLNYLIWWRPQCIGTPWPCLRQIISYPTY